MLLLSRRIMAVLVAIIMALSSFFTGIFAKKNDSNIVVLYTNDVHCAVDGELNYASLVAYRNEVRETTDYVTTVDVGDFVQGGVIGAISQGEYVVDIMNSVGYDFTVLGNHEFDYGMEQLNKLINMSDFEYLGCNLTYSGSGENLLEDVEPYEMITYGSVKVAYIGVSTPYSITSSTPKNFQDENGNYIYGFDEDTFTTVQKYVLEARAKGADYVIALTHLGDTDEFTPYSSVQLIQNTVGIDAVLDGHRHSVIEERKVENKNGDEVILSSTGTQLQNFGELTITPDGDVSTKLISSYDKKDENIEKVVADIEDLYKADMEKVIGTAEEKLSVNDENGVRIVRRREAGIGDFVTDAYRTVLEADIGISNGGGIRKTISKGDITYGDIYDVNPFGNKMVLVKATGQQIIDMLEVASRKVYSDAQEAEIGETVENGGFLQVSGLKYTVDTSIPSSVTVTNTESTIDGARRVRDVYVLQNGEYVPIDPDATYTVAGTEYVIFNGGDGNTIMKNCETVSADGLLDYEVLLRFVNEYLKGTIPASYALPEGRITIV